MKIDKTFFSVKSFYRTVSLLIASFSFFAFISCSGGIDDGIGFAELPSIPASPSFSGEEKLYEVSFRMNYEGAYPSALGRTVSVEGTRSSVTMGNPLDGYTYYIEASSPGRETVHVDSQQISEKLAFKIMLPASQWNVKAYLKNGQYKIEVGSTDVLVSEENPVPEAIISIVPRTEGSGRGSVNLAFGNLDPSIASVELYNPDMDFTDWTFDLRGIGTKPGKYIDPGIYNLTIFFNNSRGEVVYSCRETINVYAGYSTDSWFGSSSYLETTEDGASFNISSRLIEGYVQTEIYVKANVPGDENKKNGTQLSPFRTFSGAFNRLSQLNDGTSNFKIIVLSDIEIDSTDFIEDENGKSFINYNSDKNLDFSLEAATADGYKITGNHNARFFTFAAAENKKLQIEISHLEFADGGFESQYGGFVMLNPECENIDGILKLRDVKIHGCKSSYGGAIYANRFSVELVDSKIYGNSAEIAAGAVSLVYDAVLKMKGVSCISGNSSSGGGAGIYIGAESVFHMESGTIGGSAVYDSADPTWTMGNYLTSDEGVGCGIFVASDGKFYMTGGTITGNRNSASNVPTQYLYGNGIFVQSNTSETSIGGPSVVSVDNDILLGWNSTLGISGSLTAEKKYAARISLCEDGNLVPALRDMEQIEDRILEGRTFIHGAGGYSISQDDLDKIALSATTAEYEKYTGPDRECGYKYYFANSSGYGILKYLGIVINPILPGEYRFIVSSDQVDTAESGSLSFTLQKKNEEGTFENFIPDESILAVCQNGDELFRLSKSNGMISVDYDDPRIKGLFAGKYQVRMSARIQSLIIDGISDIEILNSAAP